MLRAGSGDCHHPGMSCGANRGSHPLRSIKNNSSSAADRARAQAHRALDLSCPSRLIPALPSTAYRSRGALLRALQPGYLLEATAVPGWPGEPYRNHNFTFTECTQHVWGIWGRAGPGPGLLPGNRRPRGAGRGGGASSPLREPQGRLWKRAVIPLNLHGHEAKSPQRRRCQNERKVKKKFKKKKKIREVI